MTANNVTIDERIGQLEEHIDAADAFIEHCDNLRKRLELAMTLDLDEAYVDALVAEAVGLRTERDALERFY